MKLLNLGNRKRQKKNKLRIIKKKRIHFFEKKKFTLKISNKKFYRLIH